MKSFIEKKFLDQSVAADYTSEPFYIQSVDVPGFTFSWANGVALAGDFTVQISFDKVTWFTLAIGAIPLAGAAGDHDVILTENRYKHMRAFFNITAGSADFVGWYSASTKGR